MKCPPCADLDTLESALDTIAFADIQGEDTRNFSEANFIKVFRLAQLMVTYGSSLSLIRPSITVSYEVEMKHHPV